MATEDVDRRVRLAAFEWLDSQTSVHGDVLKWAALHRGFTFEGRRVPLVSQQGIFKPALLPEIPLTLRTTPPSPGRPTPYDDSIGNDGLLRYRYRGTDPRHRDNVGLRRAMTSQVPLIYMFGIVAGEYMPIWPVYVVGDAPAARTFVVAVDHRSTQSLDELASEVREAERRYVTRVTVERLHQQSFRQRVLRAYRERCAICRLRHQELLEAAHILPDGHPRGMPIVPNGLSLCKLHHAAFDRYVIGITPDLLVEVRADVMAEGDGPMLLHGLQEFHRAKITVPGRVADQPDRDALAERYDMFRKTG